MKIMRHLSQQPQPRRDGDEHVIMAGLAGTRGDWKQLSPRDHLSNVFLLQSSLLDNTAATHLPGASECVATMGHSLAALAHP